MTAEKIKEQFEKAGIVLTEEKYQKFAIYCDFLLEYNQNVNLTAITDEDAVISAHFIDSLLGRDLIPQNARCADIGTGAGFPGVPLAIARDDISFLLVDSLNKRLTFLDLLAEKLDLKNVKTLHGRSEDLAHDPKLRQSFDCVVSRAVARLNVLLELDLPFVKKGGCLLAWKGPAADEELNEAKNALKVLGASFEDKIVFSFDENEHNIICIRQKDEISKKYPRQAGTPKKKPL